MLDGPRNTDRDIELRRHHLAGLPHLQIVGDVSRINGGPRCAHRPSQLVGQRFYQSKLRPGTQRPTTGDHHPAAVSSGLLERTARRSTSRVRPANSGTAKRSMKACPPVAALANAVARTVITLTGAELATLAMALPA